MTEYVAGFLFDEQGREVALIQKARPDWQAGRLNGIGGHIEEGEGPADAMVREFHEETGVLLRGWSNFATVIGRWGQVYFYRAFSNAISDVRTVTDEPVLIFGVDEIPWGDCLPNLSWLIPLARYRHDLYRPIMAREVSA